MTLGMDKLIYTVHGKKAKIRFIHDSDLSKINMAIKYLKDNIGRARKDIDFDEINYKFDNWKLAKGILHILTTFFFRFKQKKIREILTLEEINLLKRNNISDVVTLRLKFYYWVEKEYRGVIPSKEYNNALERFSKDIGIDWKKLKEILYIDDDENKVLTEEQQPTAEDIKQIYNFEALSTVLYYAKKVIVKMELVSGGLMAKNIYFACKQRGLLCDFLVEKNTLTAVIYGPMQFYGRQTKYGLGIAFVIYQIFKNLKITDVQIMNLDIETILRDREYRVYINPEEATNIKPPFEEPTWEGYFDSNAEKRFYWTIKNSQPRGWGIIREPEPILLENTIAIPDFVLVKNERKIYVELVGYWREEYVKKKLKTLKAIAEKNIPLLLIVNAKHKGIFELLKIPLVYYKTDSYGKLIIPFNVLFSKIKEIESKFYA